MKSTPKLGAYQLTDRAFVPNSMLHRSILGYVNHCLVDTFEKSIIAWKFSCGWLLRHDATDSERLPVDNAR